jgi:hypothetical protein
MQVQEDNSDKPKDVKGKTNLFKNSEPISPTTKTAQEIRTELSNEVTFGPLISFMYFRPTKQTSFLQDHPMNIPTKRIRLKCRNLWKKMSSTTTYAK